MDDLLKRDATDQLVALNARRVSAVELLKGALARHEQTHAQHDAGQAHEHRPLFGGQKTRGDAEIG